VPWGAIAVAFLFFPAAYLFFGSLMLGTGALGGNAKEANQLGMLWALLVVTPFPFVEALLSEPGGTLARVLTWLPFAAPITVVLRTAADPGAIAWWEIAGSVLVLVASTWLAVTLAARLFRVGLLLSGARPGLRALLRQARLG
jgi:ABC-2 type transport system permease protein